MVRSDYTHAVITTMRNFGFQDPEAMSPGRRIQLLAEASVDLSGSVTPLEILQGARAVVAQPGGWVQGDYAVDAKGRSTPPDGPDAVGFCMLMALQTSRIRCLAAAGMPALHPDNDPAYTVAFKLLDIACAKRRSISIEEYNESDGRTQEEVLAAFDEAIAAAQPEMEAYAKALARAQRAKSK